MKKIVTNDRIKKKLQWLFKKTHQLGKDKIIDARVCIGAMLFIEGLQEKKHISVEELQRCNDLLKYMRDEHEYLIDFNKEMYIAE